jgi:PAS domain S-box-containing protein
MKNQPQSNHKQLLDAVWESSADAMRITDLKGTVISVNDAYCKLTGFERDQLNQKPFFIVYLKDVQKEYFDEYRNRLSTGKILERLEKKVTFLNGTQRYLEQSNSFIEISGEKFVLSIFRDITEFMQAVDDVREGKEKYKNLYRMIRLMCDNAVDMIWAKDLNNRYLFANKAMCDNLLNAKDTDEPVGKTDMFFAKRERESHPDNPSWHTFGEICRDSDTIVLRKKKKQRFDEYGNVKGKFLYLDVYKTPFYNEQDKIIGTVGSGRDVTKEKQLEKEFEETRQKLVESEEKYRTMVEASHDIILLINTKGYFEFINKRAEEITGYKIPDWLGKSFKDIVHKDYISRADKGYRNALNKKHDSFETKITDSRGNELILNLNIIPILEDGKVRTIVCFGRDITGQKKAEELFRKSELTYRSIIDSVTEAIYIQDENGKFLDVNLASEKMYGYGREEFIGKTPEFLSAPDKNDLKETEKAIKSAFEGKPNTIEFWGIKKDGTVFPKEVSLSSGVYYGKKVVIAVARDITDRKKAEEAEKSHRMQLRAVLDTVPSYIFAKDYDGKFLMVNKSLADLFEVSPEEVVGKTDADYGATRDQIEWYTKADRQVIDSGKPLLIKEERVLRKDGSLGWFQTNKVPYRHPGVDKPAILGVAVDITERKKAEEALKESEERLRLAMTVTKQGWFDLNLPTGKIEVSPEYAKMLGFEPDEFKTNLKIWEKNIHPDDRDKTLKIFYEGIEKGEAKPLEYRRRTKTGDYIWVHSIGKIFEYDSDNKPLRMIGTQTDISERKKAEEEITMLANALKSVNECVSITDIKNNIIFVNQAFLKTYGYSEDEIIGKNITVLGSDKNPPDIHNIILKKSINGIWQGEMINKRKDGTEFPVYLSSASILDNDGKIIALIGVASDISYRKKEEQMLREAKEEAEEMNRLKSSFLANMSHELRTPLHGILGFSDIILEKEDLNEIKNIAGIIQKSGKRLLNTLNQILDLSSLEANAKKIECRFVDVLEIVRDSIELFKVEVQKKELYLTYNCASSSVITYTDPKIIYDTINNLINNAITFTKKGGISINVKEEKVNGKNSVVIDVIDTGMGIKKSDINFIFDEFRQASEGWGRSHGGSGLGLTICKRYMELLGGSISVTSEPGTGSDFKLVIPKFSMQDYRKIKIESRKSRTGDKRELPGIKKGTAEKILYVEDEQDSIELVKFFLADYFEVDVAMNAQEAVDKTDKNKYSLILMDINLREGKSGLDILSDIKKNPYYKKVPVIAVTAYAMKGNKEEFLNQGCTDYISKPFSKDILLEKVAYMLKTCK